MMLPVADRLSPRAAAAYVGVAERTYRRWLREGILVGGQRIRPQCESVGGRIYTCQAWLDDFNTSVLAAKTKTPARIDQDRAAQANAVCASSGW
jgi:hypothetical protein